MCVFRTLPNWVSLTAPQFIVILEGLSLVFWSAAEFYFSTNVYLRLKFVSTVKHFTSPYVVPSSIGFSLLACIFSTLVHCLTFMPKATQTWSLNFYSLEQLLSFLFCTHSLCVFSCCSTQSPYWGASMTCGMPLFYFFVINHHLIVYTTAQV